LTFLQLTSDDLLDAHLSTYQLDIFFPFDPYILPLSLVYLSAIYYRFPSTSIERFNKLCKEFNLEPSSSPLIRGLSDGSQNGGSIVFGEKKSHNGEVSFEKINSGAHRTQPQAIGQRIEREDIFTPSFSPSFNGEGSDAMILSTSIPLSSSLTSTFIM